jgi:copper transport protein
LVQWSHLLAVGAWIGGLAALLACIRSTPPDELLPATMRFSGFSAVAIGVVAMTGVIRAVDELRDPAALFGTSYGRLVVAKAVVITLLGALGALNRYVNLPRMRRSPVGLRRTAGVEIAVAALALVVTAVLSQTEPPTRQDGPEAGGPTLSRGSR